MSDRLKDIERWLKCDNGPLTKRDALLHLDYAEKAILWLIAEVKRLHKAGMEWSGFAGKSLARAEAAKAQLAEYQGLCKSHEEELADLQVAYNKVLRELADIKGEMKHLLEENGIGRAY